MSPEQIIDAYIAFPTRTTLMQFTKRELSALAVELNIWIDKSISLFELAWKIDAELS